MNNNCQLCAVQTKLYFELYGVDVDNLNISLAIFSEAIGFTPGANYSDKRVQIPTTH